MTANLQDEPLERELLRQNSLIYGGLILIGLYMVQPFLTAESLDLSAKICVLAFSVAIPLLAALVMVNRHETFRRRRAKSFVIAGTQVVAQLCAFTGVVAGFWQILWIAGVGILATGLVAVLVHSAGYVSLERDQEPAHTMPTPVTPRHSPSAPLVSTRLGRCERAFGDSFRKSPLREAPRRLRARR